MPKSFLVKRVQKIHTAFFPWNSTTLVPGYSLSCEVERDFKKDGYEEEASEIDVLNCGKIRLLLFCENDTMSVIIKIGKNANTFQRCSKTVFEIL